MNKKEFDEKSPIIREHMHDLLKELNKRFVRSDIDKQVLQVQMTTSAILQVDLLIRKTEVETAYDVYAGLIEILNIRAEEFTKETLKKENEKI